MVRAFYFILLLILLQAVSVHAQSKLILKHKRKTHKEKNINLDRLFEIRTTDTTYFTKIIGFTDSTLLIPIQKKTGIDTTYISTYTYTHYSKSNFFGIGQAKDTTVIQKTVVPKYQQDTTALSFSSVTMIKKDWFKNRRWLEPFGWMIVGSALGVALLPVAAIDGGRDGVRQWAVFEGALLAIALPPIFIGTRKTRYNLEKNWKLEVQ